MNKFAGAAQAVSGSVRQVVSNQDGPYKDLEKQVRKYAAAEYRRPIAEHTRNAFQTVEQFVSSYTATVIPAAEPESPLTSNHRGGAINVILDSGCGTGESTLHLAHKFPDYPVIGIDKSAVRLDKAAQSANRLTVKEQTAQDLPRNAFYIRAELIDFWRLALDKVRAGQWVIPYHALYYPNPWPKQSEAGRRFHLHPVFPTLLQLAQKTELRTNWEVYAQEFAQAARLLLPGADTTIQPFQTDEPITAFERKYNEAHQTLWRVIVSH